MTQLQRNATTIRAVLQHSESIIYTLTGLQVSVQAKYEQADVFEAIDEADIIIYNLCKIWHITKADLLIKRRAGNKPNMIKIICMVIRHQFPKYPLVKIASKLGMADHTSVMHNIAACKDLLDVKDEAFMKYYQPVKHLFDAGD